MHILIDNTSISFREDFALAVHFFLFDTSGCRPPYFVASLVVSLPSQHNRPLSTKDFCFPFSSYSLIGHQVRLGLHSTRRFFTRSVFALAERSNDDQLSSGCIVVNLLRSVY